MLSLRKTKASFGLDFQEVPEPRRPGPGEVTLKVEAVGICGSDVHAYEWTEGFGFMAGRLPVTMGHEFAGRVVARGPDTSLPDGTRVTVAPFITCGICAACRRDDARNCTRRELIGLTVDGGFAGHVTLPARNCLVLPATLDDELGALTEPLGVGCEAVLVGEVKLGDTVLVMGPGTIGQGIALMARAAGAARVLVAGRGDQPRFDVLGQLGFHEIIDVAEGPLGEQVLARTGGEPVDVVLEATGHPAAIADGMGVLRKGGVIVAVGIHAEQLTFNVTDFVRNRQQLRASHGTSFATFGRVLSLMAREPEAFRAMITHRMPLARGIEGFELARQRAASKVMLRP
ncbi:MAG: sorbitol dehydrogenase [Alphaproteobacteria bacterium]|nr:sorbitol dehydrogenase [Alphaproteobacteria bacterium]